MTLVSLIIIIHLLIIKLARMAWWKVWESTGTDGQPKTINIVTGYFILMNYCIGTGFLGIPYAFFYSGYLVSIPTLIFAAFSAYVTSRWLFEVIARAQVNYTCNILVSILFKADAKINHSACELKCKCIQNMHACAELKTIVSTVYAQP